MMDNSVLSDNRVLEALNDLSPVSSLMNMGFPYSLASALVYALPFGDARPLAAYIDLGRDNKVVATKAFKEDSGVSLKLAHDAVYALVEAHQYEDFPYTLRKNWKAVETATARTPPTTSEPLVTGEPSEVDDLRRKLAYANEQLDAALATQARMAETAASREEAAVRKYDDACDRLYLSEKRCLRAEQRAAELESRVAELEASHHEYTEKLDGFLEYTSELTNLLENTVQAGGIGPLLEVILGEKPA